jgi:hypothetical protein
MSRAVLARRQREAAALAALVGVGDLEGAGLLLSEMDDADVAVLAVRLAGWLGSELSARFQRERCLTPR